MNHYNEPLKYAIFLKIKPSHITDIGYALLLEGCTMTLTPFLTSFLTWFGARGALLSQTLLSSRRMAKIRSPLLQNLHVSATVFLPVVKSW